MLSAHICQNATKPDGLPNNGPAPNPPCTLGPHPRRGLPDRRPNYPRPTPKRRASVAPPNPQFLMKELIKWFNKLQPKSLIPQCLSKRLTQAMLIMALIGGALQPSSLRLGMLLVGILLLLGPLL